MDFFKAQDSARHKTKLLVLLFLLAITTLLVLSNLLILYVWDIYDNSHANSHHYSNQSTLNTPEHAENTTNTEDPSMVSTHWNISRISIISSVVLVLIILGSIYKSLSLKSGARSLVESIGGRRLYHTTQNQDEKRVLNVVEEMAIASGTPIPAVYLLPNEQGINAFTTGETPSDAVIGITQGALLYLNRDEIQGVIAHEFSHILNGDARLNMRLMAILHGILMIGYLGYAMLGFSRFHFAKRNKIGIAMFMSGIGLTVIGYAGSFFGNWIKSIISRQREYLADSSAVQFTRNPDGIANALKKIGGYTMGSAVEHPHAAQLSHCYFADGMRYFMGALFFPTHPSLKERLRRLDKRWDGHFIHVKIKDHITHNDILTHRSEQFSNRQSAFLETAIGIGIHHTAVNAADLVDSIGMPKANNLGYANTVLKEIDTKFKNMANECFSARAIIYALLLSEAEHIRMRQLEQLHANTDAAVSKLTEQIFRPIKDMKRHLYLPLIDLAMASLQEFTEPQYRHFKSNVNALIMADNKIELFEWALQKMLTHHLDASVLNIKPRTEKYKYLRQLAHESATVLSLFAYAAHNDFDSASEVFNTAIRVLPLSMQTIALTNRNELNLKRLNHALDQFAQLRSSAKPILLRACATCIRADKRVTELEVELLRTVASSIDCPMPLVKFTGI